MYLNEKTPLRQIEALFDALSIFVPWLFLVCGMPVLYRFSSADVCLESGPSATLWGWMLIPLRANLDNYSHFAGDWFRQGKVKSMRLTQNSSEFWVSFPPDKKRWGEAKYFLSLGCPVKIQCVEELPSPHEKDRAQAH